MEILNTPRQWPHIEEKNTTYNKIAHRFFWHNILLISVNMLRIANSTKKQPKDLKSQPKVQKSQPKVQKSHPKVLKSLKVELNLIPVSSSVMKQVGGGICNFPELDGYLHAIVLIYCFSKLSEAKPIKDKSIYRSIFVQRDVSALVL